MLEEPAQTWRARALAATVIALAGAFIWGPWVGMVYPEWSTYASATGVEGGGLHAVLDGYLHSFAGWYRPTAVFLAPYLLRVDYLHPSSVWTANLAFLVLVAVTLMLVVRPLRLGAALVAGLSIAGSSVLFYVPYDAQVDSLYILFGIAFIAVAVRLATGDDTPRVRLLLWAALALAWAGAVTSKEIGAVAPLVALAFILMAAPRPDMGALRRAVRTLWPFLVASLLFAIAFEVRNPNPGGGNQTSTAHPGLGKLSSVRDMVFWGLGLRAPGSDKTNWEVHFDKWVTLLAALLIVSALAALALVWRDIGLPRLALFAATYLLLAGVIGAFGSVPYHAFPLVTMVAFGAMVVLSRAVEALAARGVLTAVAASGALVVVALAQVGVARHVSTNALEAGPQSGFIAASTELVDSGELRPVRLAQNPFLVFEDCLGMGNNVLFFYAHATSGSELIVPSLVASAKPVSDAESAALAAGRPVFVASCTGHADPYYAVEQVFAAASP
jgi:hypothetical protein